MVAKNEGTPGEITYGGEPSGGNCIVTVGPGSGDALHNPFAYEKTAEDHARLLQGGREKAIEAAKELIRSLEAGSDSAGELVDLDGAMQSLHNMKMNAKYAGKL